MHTVCSRKEASLKWHSQRLNKFSISQINCKCPKAQDRRSKSFSRERRGMGEGRVGVMWSMCGQVKAGGHLRTAQRRRRRTVWLKTFYKDPQNSMEKIKLNIWQSRGWCPGRMACNRGRGMGRGEEGGGATLALVGVRDKVKLLNWRLLAISEHANRQRKVWKGDGGERKGRMGRNGTEWKAKA